MWTDVVDYEDLTVFTQSGAPLVYDPKGEIVGFFIKDEETIRAIKEHDPRILLALNWAISKDGKDYYTARWACDPGWFGVMSQGDDYEDILKQLIDNPYAIDSIKEKARNELQKIVQRTAKKVHSKRRRAEFQQGYDRLALALIERDGYRCAECGAFEGLTIDHIIPLSKGGSDELDNLRFLCRSHNSKKGDR